jgi:putative transposase
VYEWIQQEASGGSVSVSGMCKTLGLCRAEYYRWQSGRGGVDVDVGGDLELREEIQRVALEWSSYGYRRVTAELRRRGIGVNHKRVLRLMRGDNLLCLRKKSRIRTTDSGHGYGTYPNLARDLELSGVNQLWVASGYYIHPVAQGVRLSGSDTGRIFSSLHRMAVGRDP